MGALEQLDVERLGHLGEAGQLVGARRRGREAAARRPRALVPAQVLEGEPASPLDEGALDLAEVDERREAVADVVDDVDAQGAVLTGEAVDLDLRRRGPVREVLEGRPAHHRRVPVQPLGPVEAGRPQLDAQEVRLVDELGPGDRGVAADGGDQAVLEPDRGRVDLEALGRDDTQPLEDLLAGVPSPHHR